MDLPATVLPFILRGVSLVGIDSVMAPMDKRLKAWQRLSKDLDMEKLGNMVIETTLDEIINFGQSIIDGQVRGRVVVNIAK